MEDNLFSFFEYTINDENLALNDMYEIKLSHKDWLKVLKQLKIKNVINLFVDNMYNYDLNIESDIHGNKIDFKMDVSLNDDDFRILQYFLDKNIEEGIKKVLQSDINEYLNKACTLTKFEYDLLSTNDQNHDRSFKSFATYRNMKKKGYFKGVYDDNMSIKDILKLAKVKN